VSARLTLICHASTSAIRAAAFPLDEPIDQAGQAKAAAHATGVERIDAAWAGPELRARQTAEALGVDASVAPVLRDIDLGRWAGRSFDTVLAAEPEAIAAWIGDPGAAPHGGESVADVVGRVAPWLDAIRRDAKQIVAVTHPTVIRAAVVIAINAGAGAFWHIDVAPLCHVTLRGNQTRWTLRSLGV
jgi:broad specificity phosphatase PhoE